MMSASVLGGWFGAGIVVILSQSAIEFDTGMALLTAGITVQLSARSASTEGRWRKAYFVPVAAELAHGDQI